MAARSNFNGTQPSGTWKLTSSAADPNIVISGVITCLQVVNNVAFATGIITDTRNFATTANAAMFAMTDTGKFGVLPDLFSAFLTVLPPGEFAVCPNPLFFSQQPVLEGVVVVQDATH